MDECVNCDGYASYDDDDDNSRASRSPLDKFLQLMEQTDELVDKFVDFKDNLQFPRFYLSYRFSNMKNEVDYLFNKNIQENSNDLSIKEQLQKNYLEIIEHIESFENECLAKHNSKRAKEDTPDKPNERVESLEKELNTLHKEIKTELKNMLKFQASHNDSDSDSESDSDTDTECDPNYKFNWLLANKMYEDFSKSLEPFEKLIEVEKLELYRKLFLHKTMVFVENDDDSSDFFSRFSNCSNISTILGKLFVTDIDHFSRDDFFDILYERKEFLETFGDHDIEEEENVTDRLIQLIQLKNNLEPDNRPDHIHQLDFSEFRVKFCRFKEFKITNKHLKIYPDLKKVTLEKIFKQIPSDLFRGFNQLTKIRLAENQLIDLDKDIFKDLINLVEIDLIDNNLETLHPETFKNCISLKIINLQRNKLKDLNENTFHGLINLESIDLGWNALQNIHKETFSGLSKLKKLSLRSNKLKELDGDIFNGLLNLDEIDLSAIFITELHPSTFNCCPLLSHIQLAYNKLKTLDKNVFKNLVNLEQVTLRENKIEFLDVNIFKFSIKLKRVVLSENCFPDKPEFNSISDDCILMTGY